MTFPCHDEVRSLPDPSHPEGYSYYRQVYTHLLETFPQITHWVAWFRGAKSPWGLMAHITEDAFCENWKHEYEAIKPKLTKDILELHQSPAPYMFGVSKLIEVFKRVLEEVGRQDIQVCSGSWDSHYLNSFHAMVDRDVPVIPLDYSIRFGTKNFRDGIMKVSKEREVLPIIWAHHDDHSYIGRCYRPYDKLSAQLDEMGARSFGVIHWTMRPLDLYFKSTARQVWVHTRDEPLEVTCEHMARDLFGEALSGYLSHYLYLWVTAAPIFGAETGDNLMMDTFKLFDDEAQVIHYAKERLAYLENCPCPFDLDEDAHRWLEFYIDFERFVIAFHECFGVMRKARLSKLEEGRALLSEHDPKNVLEVYARHIRHGQTTTSEKAVLYSLATRWLPYYIELCQVFGLVPIRVRFGETQHDPLAVGAGQFTFYLDAHGEMWKQLGQRETGFNVLSIEEGDAHERKGIRIEDAYTVKLRSWFGKCLQSKPSLLKLHLLPTNSDYCLEVVYLGKEGQELDRSEFSGGERLSISLPKSLDIDQVRLHPTCSIVLMEYWLDCEKRTAPRHEA